jgi:GNAT superfamily N-acetyltransferase
MIMVRPARDDDVVEVASILEEASGWLEARGQAMWVAGELDRRLVEADVRAGAYQVASVEGVAAGIVRFQLDDQEFWPDLPHDHASAFVHRLAVRRRFAGCGVSTALLEWSAKHARELGRTSLRLDCDINRIALRQLYERFGFQYHSEWHAGPYHVARYELLLSREDASAVGGKVG